MTSGPRVYSSPKAVAVYCHDIGTGIWHWAKLGSGFGYVQMQDIHIRQLAEVQTIGAVAKHVVIS